MFAEGRAEHIPEALYVVNYLSWDSPLSGF